MNIVSLSKRSMFVHEKSGLKNFIESSIDTCWGLFKTHCTEFSRLVKIMAMKMECSQSMNIDVLIRLNTTNKGSPLLQSILILIPLHLPGRLFLEVQEKHFSKTLALRLERNLFELLFNFFVISIRFWCVFEYYDNNY